MSLASQIALAFTRVGTEFKTARSQMAALPYKGAARLATVTVDVSTTSAPATIDNVAPTAGDVVLLLAQTTTPSTGGPWVWAAAGSAMTRPANWASTTVQPQGASWMVLSGSFAGRQVFITNVTPVTVDTTTPTFANDGNEDVQVLTANGTWTKPLWVSGSATVDVVCIGGGAGGGGGALQTATGGCSGGGGGAGGCYTERRFRASDLSATVSVVVGAAGSGGAARPASTTAVAGNAGGQGGVSSFGNYLKAGAGFAPSGGGLAGSAGGGTANIAGGEFPGGAGGAGNNGAAGSAPTPPSLGLGPSGGASGGGISTGGVAFAGGAASQPYWSNPPSTPGGGAAGGGAGGAGSSVSGGSSGGPGLGGGGGGSSVTSGTPGGTGGAGANYGGGGGGGGSARNDGASASGAGGNGGAGVVIVITRP